MLRSAISKLHSDTVGYVAGTNYAARTNFSSDVPRVIETHVHHQTSHATGGGGGSGLYREPQPAQQHRGHTSEWKAHVGSGSVAEGEGVHQVLGSSAHSVGRYDVDASGLRISQSSSSPPQVILILLPPCRSFISSILFVLVQGGENSSFSTSFRPRSQRRQEFVDAS